MNKRAQVTIFVIIAILLVVSVAMIFLFRDRISPIIFPQSNEQKVKSYVESCIKDEGNFALFVLGIRGGHIKLQEPYFSTNNFNTSYLYYYGENRVPSLADMEKELSSVITENLEYCTNFSIFPDLSIQPGDISTETTINENGVKISVQWPLVISKGDNTIQLQDFSAEFPIYLDIIQKQATSIVLMEQAHPETIDNIYLLNLYSNITFTTYPDGTVVYILRDSFSRIGDAPYFFLFANKLNLGSNSTI